MKQYLDLVRDVIENGTLQGNRTGIRTISLPGAMLRFDLQKASRPSPRASWRSSRRSARWSASCVA